MGENRIRRLTPTECERLQGLPDGWTKQGNFDGEVKPISDVQRYKTLGNAVTVNVIKDVATELFEVLAMREAGVESGAGATSIDVAYLDEVLSSVEKKERYPRQQGLF